MYKSPIIISGKCLKLDSTIRLHIIRKVFPTQVTWDVKHNEEMSPDPLHSGPLNGGQGGTDR